MRSRRAPADSHGDRVLAHGSSKSSFGAGFIADLPIVATRAVPRGGKQASRVPLLDQRDHAVVRRVGGAIVVGGPGRINGSSTEAAVR